MPSEETWNFDVHEEACREPTATMPPISDGENSQQSGGAHDRQTMITEEQVKQMEKIWLSRMEKLERRLMRAVEGEQRARDQMALLSEEKDRRIAALERQLDMLEANDFHLTKTIHTLEQLERVFTSHFLGTDIVQPHRLHSSKTSINMVERDDENCKNNELRMDQVTPASKETIIDDRVGHPCTDETCLQCHVCQTLKGTIERLHLALAEQSEVDRRVRQLEEDMQSGQSTTSDNRASVEVINFEAEYRELEALVKELKQALVVDRSTVDCPVIRDCSPVLGQSRENEREDRTVSSLSVHWNLDVDDDDDETVSMVTSPDSEVDSPALAALNERNRLLEISEQYLRQQISDLETERDQLREMVRSGETTISDLGTSLVQLQSSEKSMSTEASRLRAKNEWMAGRIDALLELVGRLEEADRAHRTTAGELRLRAERHCVGEADLRRELDNAVDEQQRTETRYRRWVAQLEDERDALATRVDDLAERNAELEGREAALEYRVRQLETTEQGLRCELADLERTLGDKNGELFEERLLTGSFSSSHNDLQRLERAQNNCQTTGVIAFLKQKLERVDRTNVVLEERLREKAACEERLRETIKEYEKSDNIWQEKVVSLEAQKKSLMQKIDDLEAHLTDFKQRHQLRDDMLSAKSADDCDELGQNDYQLHDMNSAALEQFDQGLMYSPKDRPAATMKGFAMLDTVVEDADDEEMAYWATVEDATHVDDDDSAVTSPHWENIEQMMGLNTEEGEENETFVKESTIQAVDKTNVETEMLNDSSPELSLSLPVSPPPEPEIAFVAEQTTGSSIPVDKPFESLSTMSLKCTDQKPEVEGVDANRKLFVVRATDIRRSRSADIFRSDNVAATFCPATVRAQSETRDVTVTDSWNALSTTHQTLAVENLTAPQEKRASNDDEAWLKQDRKNDELDSMSELQQPTNNEETQTGSGNVTVRRSLIPRIAPTQTSRGRVSRSPALVVDLPVISSGRPGLTVVAVPGGQSQSPVGGRNTPRPICSTPLFRSLIPRLVTDNRKNYSGGESQTPSTSNAKVSCTSDKSADENNSETSQSSFFLGSLSSTGACSEDARQEPAQSSPVHLRSVSSSSSCPGDSNVAAGGRE